MRVAHVITRLIVGGAQENTLASVLGLRQKPDVDIKLFSGPTSGPEGSLEPAVAAFPGLLSVVPELVRPIHPLKDWLALRRMTSLFRELRPGIVHTHSGKAGILGRVAAARAGVPVIIHTVHGPSFGSFQTAAANLPLRAAERYAARFTTHFVVVAEAMKQQYLAAGIGTPDQFTKIFSGFCLKPFLSTANEPGLRKKLGIAPEDIVIGKIARLFKLKGHDDLFAIAPALVRACPRLKFLLVGDGDWRQRFERQARANSLQDHFIFTGLVEPDAIPKLLGIMDILVHLSLREGLARALPQAMAAARPVVAYNCDGAAEVCLPDDTGFLVAPGDWKQLTERLLQLARDSNLRARLGQRGRELAKARFSAQGMVEDLYELYVRLVRHECSRSLA